MKTGERVGAICSDDGVTVRLYGYGVYAGEEVPPKDINPWLNFNRPNPKITLDDGTVIWGCECWWGSEEKVKKSIGERQPVMVNIEEHRREQRDALSAGDGT